MTDTKIRCSRDCPCRTYGPNAPGASHPNRRRCGKPMSWDWSCTRLAGHNGRHIGGY